MALASHDKYAAAVTRYRSFNNASGQDSRGLSLTDLSHVLVIILWGDYLGPGKAETIVHGLSSALRQ